MSGEPANKSGRTVANAGTTRARKTAWLLFGTLLGLYLLSGKGFTEILDAEVYYLLTKALVEEGKVSIRPELTTAVVPDGEWNPDGRAYSRYGVGYPLVLVPFYVVGKAVAAGLQGLSPRLTSLDRLVTRTTTSAALAVITAGTAVAVFYLAMTLGCGVRAAAWGALGFGLATYAWPYAKIGFYEPFLSLCLTLTVLWAFVYKRTGSLWWPGLAGFALGWGLATKLSLGFATPFVGGYILHAAWRDGCAARARNTVGVGLAFLAGMAPWAGVMVLYNLAREMAPWGTGYPAGDYTPTPNLLLTLQGLYGNLLAPGRGYFVYSPVTALFVLAIPTLWRRARAELLTVTLFATAYVVWISGIRRLVNDYAWGPRMLVPLTGLMMALVAIGVSARWDGRGVRRVTLALAVLSVMVQLLGLAMPFGPWIDRVREETRSSLPLIYSPKHSPLWGQVMLLSQASLSPIEGGLGALAAGQPSEELKREIRRTPDFWFAYAYRLGLPRPLIAAGVATLAGLTAGMAILLARSLREEEQRPPEKWQQ